MVTCCGGGIHRTGQCGLSVGNLWAVPGCVEPVRSGQWAGLVGPGLVEVMCLVKIGSVCRGRLICGAHSSHGRAPCTAEWQSQDALDSPCALCMFPYDSDACPEQPCTSRCACIQTVEMDVG